MVADIALTYRGIYLTKGREIVAIYGYGIVRLSINIKVLYKAQHKNKTTGDYIKFGTERVNVFRFIIKSVVAINIYGPLEVRRFNIGHNFPAEGSLHIFTALFFTSITLPMAVA